MTKDRKAKKAARAFSRVTGVPYTVARRATAEGDEADKFNWDDFEPKSLDKLLAGAPQSLGDHLIGEEIGVRGSGSTIEIEVPDDMRDPTVHAFHIPDTTIVVQVDEEFEGGTLACNGSANGKMTVQVLMSKAEAETAIATGRASMLLADWDDDDSAVGFDLEVEVNFQAIVNPDYEGVEDVMFDGIVVVSG